MKPISCNQEMGSTERFSCPGALQGPALCHPSEYVCEALIPGAMVFGDVLFGTL